MRQRQRIWRMTSLKFHQRQKDWVNQNVSWKERVKVIHKTNSGQGQIQKTRTGVKTSGPHRGLIVSPLSV